MPSFNLASILNLPSLSNYLHQLDECLAAAIKSDYGRLETPIAPLLQTSGKRLRPALLMSVVASQDIKIDNKVIKAATAVQMIHLGSLIHDDVIDNSATRWGLPTISNQEGPASAIVAGDYLYARAAQLATEVSPEVSLTLAKALASLCEGQNIEIADQGNIDRSLDNMTLAIRGKTAALLRAAAEIGGHCASLEKVTLDALGSYGDCLGMSFQLIDDLMDFLSTTKLSGKNIGDDMQQGVYTMPVLIALQSPSANHLRQLLTKKSKRLHPQITELLLDSGAVDATLRTVCSYNRQAVEALNSIDSDKSLETLKKLPDAYMRWTIKELVDAKYQPRLASVS